MKKLKIIGIAIVTVGFILLVVNILVNPTKNKNATSSQATKPSGLPCSIKPAPCIAITDESGKEIAKTSDFRIPNRQGCIDYLVKTQWHEHCGGYNLNWIGPGNPPGREGKI